MESSPGSERGGGPGVRFRFPRWLAGFFGAVYLACLANPLTRLFDFDVNLVLAVAAALGGAAHGAARTWRFRSSPAQVRDRLADFGTANSFAHLLLEGLAALAVVPVLALVSRALFPCCGFAWGLLYFLLGPVFSLTFGLSVGLVAALAGHSRRRSIWIALGAVTGTLVYPAVRALFVPVAFAYNPAFGYFPGPVYDPVAGMTPPYLWARLHTVLLVTTLVTGTDLILRRPPRAPTCRSRLGSALALAIALPGVVLLTLFGDRIGISSSIAAIERELDGTARTAHFVVHFPAEGRTAGQIRWAAADLEAAYQHVSRELGVEVHEPIHAYIYPSRATKKRLMGAGRTSVAFPRSRSLHINADAFPHPVLTHELVHVMTGPRGMPWVQVSPLPGLTEGVAVALEEVAGGLTVHEWAAAMMRIDKLPDLESLLSAVGFWRHPGGVAYTACGSFVRYLLDTRGPERFWQAYRWGRVSAAYGTPTGALVEEWKRFLDTVPLSEEAMARAARRFSARGLFGTPCARAKERLVARADDLFVHARPRAAAMTYQDAATLAGGDPRLFRAAIRSWLSAGAFAQARALGGRLLEQDPPLDILQRIPVQIMLGAAEYHLGNQDAARDAWNSVADTPFSTPDVRKALCLLEASHDREALSPVIDYLTLSPDGTTLLDLAEAWHRAPSHPVVTYLAARRFQAAGRWRRAAQLYQEALDAGLPHPFLTREALRAHATCAVLSGDRSLAEQALSGLETASATTAADRVLSRRLRQRLRLYHEPSLLKPLQE